ncbi:acyl carrier protein [Pseudoduganella plicata]|uniref:Acyl carrier protein n=1 Tax=Pseudoduganella plicata TaxID=321984 RepID=A0A4P7BCE3_9BURK|nr:acyl carrier protein [Pseudoduganella plicata]QBQ35662.1 acyl carrier protein [Pseudoduganella plicata]GGY96226.1 acyl carrier protein [Pseudoduganella plicata]
MTEFYEGLAEILEVDVRKVTPALDLQTCSWDSLAVVSTIALADDCFNVLLDGQSLGECNTVGDIEQLIESKKG